MAPTKPRDDGDPADYEQLRQHLRRPPLEHPAPRQRPAAPPPPRRASAVSALDWLLAIGHAVVRRLRGAPRSPMVTLHRRK